MGGSHNGLVCLSLCRAVRGGLVVDSNDASGTELVGCCWGMAISRVEVWMRAGMAKGADGESEKGVMFVAVFGCMVYRWAGMSLSTLACW